MPRPNILQQALILVVHNYDEIIRLIYYRRYINDDSHTERFIMQNRCIRNVHHFDKWSKYFGHKVGRLHDLQQIFLFRRVQIVPLPNIALLTERRTDRGQSQTRREWFHNFRSNSGTCCIEDNMRRMMILQRLHVTGAHCISKLNEWNIKGCQRNVLATYIHREDSPNHSVWPRCTWDVRRCPKMDSFWCTTLRCPPHGIPIHVLLRLWTLDEMKCNSRIDMNQNLREMLKVNLLTLICWVM